METAPLVIRKGRFSELAEMLDQVVTVYRKGDDWACNAILVAVQRDHIVVRTYVDPVEIRLLKSELSHVEVWL